MPLLRWIVLLWIGTQLPLTLDATALGTRFVVLAICVIYRGCAIPVAWTILPANQPGAWHREWLRLLRRLRPASPPAWTVLVLTDRGLYTRGNHRRANACRDSPSEVGASHTFARRRSPWLLWAGARWSKRAGRCDHPQGTALRPRSMMDRLQNFQRAGFRIARVVHLHTGSQIRVQVRHGSLGRFWHRRL